MGKKQHFIPWRWWIANETRNTTSFKVTITLTSTTASFTIFFFIVNSIRLHDFDFISFPFAICTYDTRGASEFLLMKLFHRRITTKKALHRWKKKLRVIPFKYENWNVCASLSFNFFRLQCDCRRVSRTIKFKWWQYDDYELTLLVLCMHLHCTILFINTTWIWNNVHRIYVNSPISHLLSAAFAHSIGFYSVLFDCRQFKTDRLTSVSI